MMRRHSCVVACLVRTPLCVDHDLTGTKATRNLKGASDCTPSREKMLLARDKNSPCQQGNDDFVLTVSCQSLARA